MGKIIALAIYEDYLGKPLGEKSETLLHTHYFNKAIDRKSVV